MNKNAYEIRLEILGMAHGDCMTVYYEKLNSRKVEHLVDGGQRERALTDEEITELLPTSADIAKRAEELYKFISQ
jgi:hypothetical protein